MSTILRRICEVELQNNFILYLYIGLENQHEEYGKWGRYRTIWKCTEILKVRNISLWYK